MSTDIVVFGSRVRDVSVDLNLPSLYRIDRKMRDAIWFEGNDPVLKAQTWLETKIRERTFWFYLEINTQAMDKKARKDLQSYRSGLYKLRGGAKYELTEHGTFNAPRNREGSAPLVIEAPCLGWSWGGGGVAQLVNISAINVTTGSRNRIFSPIALIKGT